MYHLLHCLSQAPNSNSLLHQAWTLKVLHISPFDTEVYPVALQWWSENRRYVWYLLPYSYSTPILFQVLLLPSPPPLSLLFTLLFLSTTASCAPSFSPCESSPSPLFPSFAFPTCVLVPPVPIRSRWPRGLPFWVDLSDWVVDVPC